MDRGVWQDTVHGVTKSQTWLSIWASVFRELYTHRSPLASIEWNCLFCILTHQVAKSPPSFPHFWTVYWSGKNNIHRELFWPDKQSHKALLSTQPLLGSDVRKCCQIGVSGDLHSFDFSFGYIFILWTFFPLCFSISFFFLSFVVLWMWNTL